MRVLTVDWLTLSLSAALMKLPSATTVRNVRASSVSIGGFRMRQIGPERYIDKIDFKLHNYSFVKTMHWPTFEGKPSIGRVKSMSTLKQVQQPTLAALAARYLSFLFTPARPQYSAVTVATAVAASGNPAGT